MDNNQDTQGVEAITLKDFITSQGFTQLATKQVRYNVNGYPFLTFIDAKNEATNVYFSKNESTRIKEMEVLDSKYLKSLNVVNTTNDEGEQRYKLTTSERVNLDELWAA